MTVEKILSNYDPDIAALALHVRVFLTEQLPGCIEVPDHSLPLTGFGYGTGYKETVCVIMVSKKGVKLSFNKGAELPDPAKLLEGTGKVHRYVVIHSKEDLENPALKDLVKAGKKHLGF